MTLWIVFAFMTGVALLALLWPLRRAWTAAAAQPVNDSAVYRDQLQEVECDLAAGSIGANEAEAARIEVSRRLLAAEEAEGARIRDAKRSGQMSGKNPGRTRRLSVAIAAIVLTFGVAGLYLTLGSPDLPGQPLAERMAKAHGEADSIQALFKRVEAHLQQHPEDGRGWEVIAPVYMRLGRYADAAKARDNALRLLGPTAQRQADLGEALVAAENGVVTAQAKEAFDAAIGLDPGNVSARFYEGLAAEQDGSREDAARIWRALLAEAPEGAQWAGLVREALARVESPGTAPAPMPSTGAPNSPSSSAAPQDQMIRAMVERLAARLQQDGSDPDGWVRLLRSYMVLGESDKARAALTDARRALESEPEKLRRFEEGAKGLGVAQTSAPSASTPTSAAASAAPQDQMIRGMVERLAARLHQDGSDADGWVRLLRSYMVLGENEKVQAALADARRALESDPEKLRRFEEGAKSLGTAQISAPSASAPSPPAASAPAQDAMIRAMVEQLTARLQQDGSDPDGWVRLLRSYVALGESEKVRATFTDARRALQNEPEKLRRFEEDAKSLGIEG
jgi:cytochrome c-type biogenesis protein CcmH